MSTAEEQGWVPATYLESQNGTRDDSDINTSKLGEGMENFLLSRANWYSLALCFSHRRKTFKTLAATFVINSVQ